MAVGQRDRRGREPEIRVDWNGVTGGIVGREVGLPEEEFDALRPRLEAALEELRGERGQGLRPFLDLPYRRAEIDAMRARAAGLRGRFDTLVRLGIGGSASGVRAIVSALARPGDGLGLVVADNIDPGDLTDLLDTLDLDRTLFDVVTKSGETPETMAQFLVVRDRLLREFGADGYREHLLVTTDARRGALRQVQVDEGLPQADYPPEVGGRFSILSAVHLLSADLLGVDVESLLAGAIAMDERCRNPDPGLNPAARLAGTRYLLDTLHGFPVAVLMPYSERLLALADWWLHLWSESLGKRIERDGESLAVGQTALVAIGASDQHSLLQLFLDGPADKLVTFLRVEEHGGDVAIPGTYPDIEDIAWLGGRSLGELLNAEQEATEAALALRSRPSMRITLPAVTPHALGQLIHLLEVEVLLAAHLFGVDPVGQPAVDLARRLVFGLCGRPGFEPEQEAAHALRLRRQSRFVL